MKRLWWKEAVVYQIYPRSFMDSNGDGFGDCEGVISKLEYLKRLGVDVLWLSPVYKSPMDDNGYDISDYYDINPEFGTLEQMKKLLDKAHGLGMRLIMDLVVNHTSDEHEWFIQSRSSRDNPYRDYYIWKDPVDDHEPNDWGSYFSGPAWDFDEATGQYYMHLFSKKQPDLNWENEKVRKAIYEMMAWWCELGVDGFRLDTSNMYSKVAGFPSSGRPLQLATEYFIDGPRIHEFINGMYENVFSKFDVMSVGECPFLTPEKALKYVAPERRELNMLFQFEHIEGMGVSKTDKFSEIVPVDPYEFKTILAKWQKAFDGKGWNSQYLSNHDQPRQISRFGDNTPASAKALCTLLHTLQGTPYVYQGEELGMTNCEMDFSDMRDVQELNYLRELDKKGVDRNTVKDAMLFYMRDNARTPMQWANEENAGFTAGKSWIKINPNYAAINARDEEKDAGSVFNYYKAIIALRHRYPVLTYGSFEDISADNRSVFGYVREFESDRLLVMINLTGGEAAFECPLEGDWRYVIGNLGPAEVKRSMTLAPWQACVFSDGEPTKYI